MFGLGAKKVGLHQVVNQVHPECFMPPSTFFFFDPWKLLSTTVVAIVIKGIMMISWFIQAAVSRTLY